MKSMKVQFKFLITKVASLSLVYRVIAVGVTSSVDDSELEALATQSDFEIRVSNFSALNESFFRITSKFCGVETG